MSEYILLMLIGGGCLAVLLRKQKFIDAIATIAIWAISIILLGYI